MRALVLGGVALGSGPLAQHGLRLLRRELAEQVLPDGGHYERSPVYHSIVLRDLLEVEAATGEPFLRPVVDRMKAFAAALARPDGAPALFNDGTLELAPQLELPDAPTGLVVFPDTGYAVVRDGELWLAFDCGAPGPGHLPAHAHADALSIQLWHRGRPLVVDPGTSTYDAGAERDRERSTEAHSTVALGGRSQFEPWGAFRSGPLPSVRLLDVAPLSGGCLARRRTAPPHDHLGPQRGEDRRRARSARAHLGGQLAAGRGRRRHRRRARGWAAGNVGAPCPLRAVLPPGGVRSARGARRGRGPRSAGLAGLAARLEWRRMAESRAERAVVHSSVGAVRGSFSVALRERGVILSALVFLVFAANFNAYRVFGDGEVAYAFLRKLFGEDVEAVGYQFGLALMNTPFYAAGKLVSAAGLKDFQDAPIGPATISLASNAYVVASIAVLAAVLIGMGLSHRGAVLTAAVFGTPLWYYASFSPSYSHAADTFLITATVGLLYLYFRRPGLRVVLAMGALLGLATSMRYFDAAIAAGLALGLFLFDRRRDAIVVVVSSAVTFGLLLLIPAALGVPLFAQHYQPSLLEFSPLSPFRMLFTPHRGLFIWTPLCLLGAIGYILLLRSRRGDRPFLAIAGMMGCGLIAIQLAWPVWDGGWSFSQRYFTALFPLVAIGLAGLWSVRPRLTAALAWLSVAWSLFLGLNHVFGVQQSDGAFEVAGVMIGGPRSIGDFLDLLWAYCRLKYLFGLS